MNDFGPDSGPDHSESPDRHSANTWPTGLAETREQLGRWLLQHVRARVESLARNEKLPDSVTAISGDVLTKLVRSDAIGRAPNQAYLIGATTQALVEVIADTARRKSRLKRRAPGQRLPLDAFVDLLENRHPNLLALTDALCDLHTTHPRLHTVITLRYFGGLTIPETAKELNLAESTVESDSLKARGWLLRELSASKSET